MIDERKEEMAALYALGILEPQEARAFKEELKTDEALRELVDDLTRDIASLAHVAPLKEAPDPLRDKILQSIRSTANEDLRSSAEGKVVQFKPRPLAWLPWAMAAGFAVMAGFLFQDQTKLKHQVAELQNQTDVCQMTVAMMGSMNENTNHGVAVVLWDPSSQTGVLKGENMPRPAANEDYQLWVVDPKYPQPVNAGVFNVNEKGVASGTFKPAQPTDATKFAISVEPKGGVEKHDKGPIIMMSK